MFLSVVMVADRRHIDTITNIRFKSPVVQYHHHGSQYSLRLCHHYMVAVETSALSDVPRRLPFKSTIICTLPKKKKKRQGKYSFIRELKWKCLS
jgi:hypothetical protein